jgi:hypothetical protein
MFTLQKPSIHGGFGFIGFCRLELIEQSPARKVSADQNGIAVASISPSWILAEKA